VVKIELKIYDLAVGPLLDKGWARVREDWSCL